MKIGDSLVHTALVAYSCGAGQAVAVPGSVLSFITAGVFKLKQHHYEKKAGKLNPLSQNYQARVEHYNEKTGKSADSFNKAMRCGFSFLVGGIPVAGAHLGIILYCMTSPNNDL